MRGPPYPDTVPDRSIFRGTDFRIIEIPDKRSSIIDGPPNISSAWIQTSRPPSDPPPSARNLSFHRFHSWREEGKYTKWCGNDENSIMESLSYDIIIARVAHDAKVSWKNFFLRISNFFFFFFFNFKKSSDWRRLLLFFHELFSIKITSIDHFDDQQK